jgi:hypothetical protein
MTALPGPLRLEPLRLRGHVTETSPAGHLLLEVDIDFGHGVPSGTVRRPGGTPVPFTGWIGLLTALGQFTGPPPVTTRSLSRGDIPDARIRHLAIRCRRHERR